MPRTTSLIVIRRKIKELQAKAEALTAKDKPGIKQLRALLVKYRLSRADVDSVFDARAGGRSKLAGRKLKPKYRNPGKKSETWSGRGMRPRWLTAAMKESGKKLEDFAV
jgi:DNA-binding protein H-NS